MQKEIDCLIIGAGPAGISAALYLSRFRRSLRIVEHEESRALLIPKSHNYPAFVDGISGQSLLKRLKKQLNSYDISLERKKIVEIHKINNYFLSNQEIKSKTVILATGVKDVEPELPGLQEAIKSGLVRHCPVCDAYEVIDKKIGIIGNSPSILKEALFLKRYSCDVTLITESKIQFSSLDLKKIKESNLKMIELPILKIKKKERHNLSFCFEKLGSVNFDTIYSALGCSKNNELSLQLGANHSKGELIVDCFQQTSVAGLYAAGDIVSGLNQICVAQAQGAIAASAINSLLNQNYIE